MDIKKLKAKIEKIRSRIPNLVNALRHQLKRSNPNKSRMKSVFKCDRCSRWATEHVYIPVHEDEKYVLVNLCKTCLPSCCEVTIPYDTLAGQDYEDWFREFHK